MSAASLRAFAPGLLGFILVKVLSPGYFARQDTRSPVRIAIMSLVFGMILNITFVITLLQTGWAPPHAGLAAATSLAAFFNASLLLKGLLRAGVYRIESGWLRLIAQVAVACAMMVVLLELLLERFGDWFSMPLPERVGVLAVMVGAGMLVYLVTCLIVGLRPAQFRSHDED
jgi:putative peptidoglycan lipid II flippase